MSRMSYGSQGNSEVWRGHWDKTSWPRPVIRGSIGFLCLGQVGTMPAELIIT